MAKDQPWYAQGWGRQGIIGFSLLGWKMNFNIISSNIYQLFNLWLRKKHYNFSLVNKYDSNIMNTNILVSFILKHTIICDGCVCMCVCMWVYVYVCVCTCARLKLHLWNTQSWAMDRNLCPSFLTWHSALWGCSDHSILSIF